MEKTFFMIKPDGVKRQLVGDILQRIERRGYHIERLELRQELPVALVNQHYDSLVHFDFYPAICDYMTSGPVIVGILTGHQAISGWRQMMGATRPEEALAGTIRGDFAQAAATGQAIQNLVHGSDSKESAEREIALWFGGE